MIRLPFVVLVYLSAAQTSFTEVEVPIAKFVVTTNCLVVTTELL